MKKLIGLSLVLGLFVTAHAQIPDAINKAKASATSSTVAKAGQLLTQFGSAIKTTSLLSSFTGQKSGWMAKAGKVADAASMASSIATLAGGIKPTAFKSGFDVKSLISSASTVTTMASAGGLLKSLSDGLKPESLSPGFATQKPAWESALSLLK